MEYYIGSIQLFPYTFIPMGWLLCDGRTLQVSEYNVLFSVIGANYGGNGSSNFALPNMLGLEPIPGMRYFIVNEGLYPTRD